MYISSSSSLFKNAVETSIWCTSKLDWFSVTNSERIDLYLLQAEMIRRNLTKALAGPALEH